MFNTGRNAPSVPEKDPLPAIPRRAHRTSYKTKWCISGGGFDWGVLDFEVHLCITGASRDVVKASVMSTINPRRASVALLIMKVSMPIALGFVLRVNPPFTANVPLMGPSVTLESQNSHLIF